MVDQPPPRLPDPIDLDRWQIVLPSLNGFQRPPGKPNLPIALSGRQRAGESGNTTLPLPFFWYDPPWHLASPERRRMLAESLGNWGVAVNVGSRELADGGSAPSMDRSLLGGSKTKWSCLVTRRSDRVGWCPADAGAGSLVELRLGVTSTDSLGGGYSVTQWQLLQGKGAPPENRAMPGPFAFPPEWEGWSDLAPAIAQLRALNAAAVYLSCDDSSLETLLPWAASSGADGVIVRFHDRPDWALNVFQRWQAGSAEPSVLRLWLAGPMLTAETIVKCLVLGASAVSVSQWCNAWLVDDNDTGTVPIQRIEDQIEQRLGPVRDELKSWMTRLSVDSIAGLSAVSLRRR